MNIKEEQMPELYRKVIGEQIEVYKEGPSITRKNQIPDTSDIPIENKQHWLRIPDVICVFVDMKNSTGLSASKYANTTARFYHLFTGTAVRLFSEFKAPYIDVRGDGVFALFNKDQPFRAIAAAVTFKTFAEKEFTPRIKDKVEVEIGTHVGIDQRIVLVRKLGLKSYGGRTDRQNEVWAGKPVNMASKLASISGERELIVSERFFENIQHNLVLKSCGCKDGEPTGEKEDLWEEKDLSDDKRFDYNSCQVLKSRWCERHGKDYCEKILNLDGN